MNKSEIAAKLKLSIEQKLCSLGAYVDKELPEYILVMIANKKNKESMEKDLQLFLGQDTTVFITWLHELLNKCQENPETAFNTSKCITPDIVDHEVVRSPEKKKKRDKTKSKKTRRSDDKKESRKGSQSKSHKTKSRSRSKSPRKTTAPSQDETKVMSTPDKSSKKVNLETKKDNIKITETSTPLEKSQSAMSSTVKVTERTAPKVDTMKQSVIMVQRDLKEAEMSKKRDLSHQQPAQEQPEQRSSVFSRLGKGDLRSKLSKVDSNNRREKHTVKRSGNSDRSMDSDDDSNTWHRQSKITKTNESKQANKVFFDRDMPDEGEEGLQSWFRHTKTHNTNKTKSLKSKSDYNDDSDEQDCKIEKVTNEKVIITNKNAKKDTQDSGSEKNDSWNRQSKIQSTPTEEKIVNTNFIVTLKGAEKLNISLKSRLGPKKSSNDLFVMNDEDDIMAIDEPAAATIESGIVAANSQVQEMKEANELVVGSNQSLSKCKFWPNCKNKDSCQFFHPHESCNNFPNCKYGSACLYVHPDCRFEPNCTKPDCAFTHHQPKTPAIFAATSINMPVAGGMQQRCLFYPNCTNVNCKFFHPNLPCRFGLACKAKDSCMFFHPSMPHRTELKWVAAKAAPAGTLQKAQTQSS